MNAITSILDHLRECLSKADSDRKQCSVVAWSYQTADNQTQGR